MAGRVCDDVSERERIVQKGQSVERLKGLKMHLLFKSWCGVVCGVTRAGDYTCLRTTKVFFYKYAQHLNLYPLNTAPRGWRWIFNMTYNQRHNIGSL